MASDELKKHGFNIHSFVVVIILNVDKKRSNFFFMLAAELILLIPLEHSDFLVKLEFADEKMRNEVVFDGIFVVVDTEDVFAEHRKTALLE